MLRATACGMVLAKLAASVPPPHHRRGIHLCNGVLGLLGPDRVYERASTSFGLNAVNISIQPLNAKANTWAHVFKIIDLVCGRVPLAHPRYFKLGKL